MWNYIIPKYLANHKLWYINRRWQRLDYYADPIRKLRDRDMTHRDSPSYIRSMKDAERSHLL